MNLIDRLRGYRTYIAAAFAMVAPAWDAAIEVLHTLAMDPDLPKIIPEAWRAPYTLGVTILMIYMRTITSTRPGARE